MTTLTEAKRARRVLDSRLTSLGPADRFAVPRKGWVRAIRNALGMTASELGQRMGISHASVFALEQSEKDGTARLDTIRRAAEAMDCALVYAFVPQESLEAIVRAQAERIVDEGIRGVTQTMALEDQGTVMAPEAREEAIERILTSKGLWTR